MADGVRLTPVIDIVQRGDQVLIRTEADLRPEDVHVAVHDGLLEVSVPREALRARAGASTPERRTGPDGGQAASTAGPLEGRDRSHPSGTAGAEPPLGAPDEKDFWDAQKPLISEDRVTSIHLEGFSDEQANSILEALGDDAPEEAQGGSATGADVFPSHGGFPSRNPDEEEPSS
jgi:hypothetical protein